MTKFNSNEPNAFIHNSGAEAALTDFFMLLFMRFQAFAVILVTCIMGIITCVYSPALALIKLSDITYHECSAELSEREVEPQCRQTVLL